jgi:hypothetical protein
MFPAWDKKPAPEVSGRTLDLFWQRDYAILIFDAKPAQDAQEVKKYEQAVSVAKANLDTAKSNVASAKQGDDLVPLQKKVTEATKALNDAKTVLNTAKDTQESDSKNHYVYWKEAKDDILHPLALNFSQKSVLFKVNLTEKVMILICRSTADDGLAIDQKSAATIGTDSEEVFKAIDGGTEKPKFDRIYLLDSSVADNAVTTVNLTYTDPSAAKQNQQLSTSALVDSKAKVSPAATDAGAAKGSQLISTAVIERHHIIRFSAGGGMLMTFATPTSYAITTTPATITTTTTTTTTITTAANSTTTTTVTPVVTKGSLEYVLGTNATSPQLTGVAGLTFYPFGHDTFPVGGKKVTLTYAWKVPQQSIGLFVGTSVSSLGNFTIAPAYEIFPGIQVFGGPTWWNKTTLQPNITACSGYGTSAPFQYQPPVTTTTTSTTTGTSPSTTMTTTTVAASATSGCANGDTASILAGTTVPTQSALQRAWGFGFVFNTNLFKAFTGLGK